MANEQYAKYKPQFKNLCIIKAVSSAVALLAIVFLIFVPNFKAGFIGFSFLDEIIRSFKALGGGFKSYTAILEIYQVIAIVYLLIGLIFAIVTLVRNIMCIVNMETYALEQYDKIKMRADGGKRNRFIGGFTLSKCIISAIMIEILYLIVQKFIPASGGAGSYFAYIDGVTWLIMFFILFMLAFIALTILSSVMLNKVKLAILKEDYGLTEQQ